MPCSFHSSIGAGHHTPDGKLLMTIDDLELYELLPDAVVKVATSASEMRLITADDNPDIVVGWTGSDALGNYACLASQPDRCWALPPGGDGWTSGWLNSSAGDGGFALVRVEPSGSSTLVHIFRTIGTGDRPQPR
jgi:hypothetical protein